MQLARSTTAWAMALCILGVTLLFFPWYRVAPHITGMQYISSFKSEANIYGYEMLIGFTAWYWHPWALLAVLILTFCLLLATSSLVKLPIWRSLGVGIAGVAIITVTTLFISNGMFRFAAAFYHVGLFLYLAVGAGLLIVCSLEIRGTLHQRQTVSTGPESIPVAETSKETDQPGPTKSCT